ncbi:MAG: hypothetical protein GY834_08470, partial [Bacteroidetes bacterium]|nr:hypothetical protein [Bacteroidota bacterium]
KKPHAAVIVIAILLSFLFAYLTYRYIEKLRHVKGPHIPIILLFSVLSIGLAGTYVNSKDGMPDRIHLSYLDEFNIEFERTERTDNQCDEYSNNLLGANRTFDYCRASGLDSQKYIAVIGDSHAHAIYPGIAEQARRRGYGTLLLANSSCPTLIGFSWGRNSKEIQGCKERVEQIVSIIESDNKIDKVLMATRGPVYIHGEVDGRFTLDSVNTSLSIIKQNMQTYQTYFDGFDNTLDRLQSMEHINNVYYLLENPELDFLTKEVVVRPFDQWAVSFKEDTMDKDLYLLRMKKYRDLAESHSNNSRISEVLDPMPYLCNEEKCFTYKNGNFLYTDDDHLSVFGSKYIANKLSGSIFDE